MQRVTFLFTSSEGILKFGKPGVLQRLFFRVRTDLTDRFEALAGALSLFPVYRVRNGSYATDATTHSRSNGTPLDFFPSPGFACRFGE